MLEPSECAERNRYTRPPSNAWPGQPSLERRHAPPREGLTIAGGGPGGQRIHFSLGVPQPSERPERWSFFGNPYCRAHRARA
jgi:hypothetical protein